MRVDIDGLSYRVANLLWKQKVILFTHLKFRHDLYGGIGG